MTPQQKASDLLHKFTHAEGCSRILTKDAAKGCAMICAEEILEELQEIIDPEDVCFWERGQPGKYLDFYAEREYWQSVKTEIEKL